MPGTVAVFGATGTQGRPVAEALLDAGHEVRAVTRSAARAADLAGRGATPVEADLTDLDSVRRAVDGARAVFFHAPLSAPPGSDGPALEAILDAGVEHLVVNVGMALPDGPVGEPMLDGRVALVQRLLDGGRSTVFVPTGYMENFAAPWSARRVATGELAYPRPAQDPVAWLTNDDVGRATVAALATPAALGRRLRLAGPEVLTFPEVAERLGRALGREVRFRQVSGAEYGRMVGEVLGPQAGAMIGQGYDRMPQDPNPLLAPDTAPARELLGLEFTPLETWAARRSWPT